MNFKFESNLLYEAVQQKLDGLFIALDFEVLLLFVKGQHRGQAMTIRQRDREAKRIIAF